MRLGRAPFVSLCVLALLACGGGEGDATPSGCDDGNPCTIDLLAADRSCSNTVKPCDDGDPCTTDGCDMATGECAHLPIAGCSSDACAGDACQPVETVADAETVQPDAACVEDCGPQPECPGGCDDGNACTEDLCVADGACTHQPLACDDGDACTTDSCAPSTGCRHDPKDCDDGDPCTLDACEATSGPCTHKPGQGCSDATYPFQGLRLFKDTCDQELWGEWTNAEDFALTKISVFTTANQPVASVTYTDAPTFSAGFDDVWMFFDHKEFQAGEYKVVFGFGDGRPDLVAQLPVSYDFEERQASFLFKSASTLDGLKVVLTPKITGWVTTVRVYSEGPCFELAKNYYGDGQIFVHGSDLQLDIGGNTWTPGQELLLVILGYDADYSFYATTRVTIPQ